MARSGQNSFSSRFTLGRPFGLADWKNKAYTTTMEACAEQTASERVYNESISIKQKPLQANQAMKSDKAKSLSIQSSTAQDKSLPKPPDAYKTRKSKDLAAVTTDDKDPMTTNQGQPISTDQNSLRIGYRGPTLMEDQVLREKIQHFDHERIPERVVHARGAGAHGGKETGIGFSSNQDTRKN